MKDGPDSPVRGRKNTRRIESLAVPGLNGSSDHLRETSGYTHAISGLAQTTNHTIPAGGFKRRGTDPHLPLHLKEGNPLTPNSPPMVARIAAFEKRALGREPAPIPLSPIIEVMAEDAEKGIQQAFVHAGLEDFPVKGPIDRSITGLIKYFNALADTGADESQIPNQIEGIELDRQSLIEGYRRTLEYRREYLQKHLQGQEFEQETETETIGRKMYNFIKGKLRN
jgi:hypothetical protein